MDDLFAQADPGADHEGLLARYPGAVVTALDGNPRALTEMDALVSYLQILGRMVDFTSTGTPLNLGGVRLPDVFNADWPRQARERAGQVCEPLAENRQLIGWLSDDNPDWPPIAATDRPGLLQICLSLEPGLAAYHAAW